MPSSSESGRRPHPCPDADLSKYVSSYNAPFVQQTDNISLEPVGESGCPKSRACTTHSRSVWQRGPRHQLYVPGGELQKDVNVIQQRVDVASFCQESRQVTAALLKPEALPLML
jgi:hypothetical protein